VTSKWTCIIADDHVIVRDGVRARLASRDSVELIGEAEDGNTALELIRSANPDIALLDVRMPHKDGFEVAQTLHEEGSRTKVIIFTGLVNATMVDRAFSSGAQGFVSKESHRDVLFTAIEVVGSGQQFLDPTIAARMLGNAGAQLSGRELEILGLMADGKSNIDIANSLGLAPETARNHVSSILRKMGAGSRAEAVALAFRRSMLT
jgi:DNA-binding NarL/FixJ family response regulator